MEISEHFEHDFGYMFRSLRLNVLGKPDSGAVRLVRLSGSTLKIRVYKEQSLFGSDRTRPDLDHAT